MTDQFRALCAELVDVIEQTEANRQHGLPLRIVTERLDRARALLAEPVAEPGEMPRIGHILRLAEIIREVDGKHDKGAAALAEAILSHPGIRSAGLTAALAEPEAEGPSELELEAIELALWDKYRTKGWGGEEFMYDNNFSDALEEYRAALDRWGSPAAAPVPVSELGEVRP